MIYDVTIGIPVFRARNYIKKTMESVFSQSYPSIEILIVDDCGGDGSMEIVQRCQHYYSRGRDIRVIKNEKNCGVSYSRNKIIDEAKGRYLFFLDSDDMIEPDTIQLLYNSIVNHHAEVAYGSYEIIDSINDNPTEIYQKESLVMNNNGELAGYAFKNSKVFNVSVCNCLIDLSFLRQTGVRFVNTQYWEDLAFTYEFVPLVNKATLLSEITYHYLRRPESLSHYQEREFFDKEEILNSFSVTKYVKDKSEKYKSEFYYPYLCYNLNVNNFYIVCHILKYYQCIKPRISFVEIRDFLAHSLCFCGLFSFDYKCLFSVVMRLLSVMPTFVCVSIVWIMGKMKNAI